jgi:hypothetical protein
VSNVIPFRREVPRRRLLHVTDAGASPTPIRAPAPEPAPEPDVPSDWPSIAAWAGAVYAERWGPYPGPSPLARRGDGGRYRPVRQRPTDTDAESEGDDGD